MASGSLPLPSGDGSTDPEALIVANAQALYFMATAYETVDDVDTGGLFMVPILANLFHAARRPLDRNFVAIDKAIDLLRSKRELFETLKLAHAEKDYARVAESPLIPPFISSDAGSYLESLRPGMEKLVRMSPDEILPSWDPRHHDSGSDTDKDSGIDEDPDVNFDEATLAHIASLNLRRAEALDKDFAIILYDLGSFKNDPILRDRMEAIFSKKNTFLVNTSGTGKTRLLYEGLCINWGFYLTVRVDEFLGSLDMSETITTCLRSRRDDTPQRSKKTDAEIAYNLFSAVLLARLLIFHLFLETANTSGITEEHKQRWLLMQLNSKEIWADYRDPFEWLAPKLARNDEIYMRENIADALRKIRKILGDDMHLFIVLDEAQMLISGNDSASFNDGKPLLPEIVRVWSDHMTDDQSFIFSGTDIPRALFDDGDGDAGRYTWCSGTGIFDDPELQERYVASFLPPGLRKSPTGRFLISRIWRWLRGRHRYTATFMRVLVNEGFETPHTLLNAYVESNTGFKPLDAIEHVRAEPHKPESDWATAFISVNFKGLSTDAKALFLDILLRYMATQQASPLGPENIELVSRDYALIVDAELSHIALEEPLVLVGAARALFPDPRTRPAVERYIPDHPNDYPETFVGSMRLNAPHTPQAFSHYLIFYLTSIFKRPQLLSKVFKFPHKTPRWAKQSAQLVKFHRNESLDVEYSVVSDDDDDDSPLATSTASAEETISWLGHQYGTAFCLPSSSNPDLLFALQLADESFIWVAVRAMPSAEPIPDSELKTALSQLLPKRLFADEEEDDSLHSRALHAMKSLPNRSTEPGKCSLLRVIASFPSEISLKDCVKNKTSDVASLSLTTFEGTKQEISQPEFFGSIVAGVFASHKRKWTWDDGSREIRYHKRPRSDYSSDDPKSPRTDSDASSHSPERIPVTSPKKRGPPKPLKATSSAAAADPSTPVYRNTRSHTRVSQVAAQATRERKGKGTQRETGEETEERDTGKARGTNAKRRGTRR
ncbi:hypothetical protein B0H11DRAFT_555372 [Mycena galericulata]|nr:hypothetical protein B0H11DRAFT_555372 [Mycena galericulata]